jgi:hypothetical protein
MAYLTIAKSERRDPETPKNPEHQRVLPAYQTHGNAGTELAVLGTVLDCWESLRNQRTKQPPT